MRSRAPLSPSSILDTDAFRAFLKDQKIKPVIPGKSNRKKRIRHDKSAYKIRNVIEGSVTLPNRARNKSPGTSGSRRSDDFTPRLHGRRPDGSVRSC
jgi:hypothetical protein